MEKETHATRAESSSSDDLEVQEINLEHSINHAVLLRDISYTKDTVASEQLSRVTTVKQGDGEEARHVGFWHRDLNNVRLHVFKLWVRTGEANQNPHSSLGVDCFMASLDPYGVPHTGALPLLRCLLPHPKKLLIVDRLRRRLRWANSAVPRWTSYRRTSDSPSY